MAYTFPRSEEFAPDVSAITAIRSLGREISAASPDTVDASHSTKVRRSDDLLRWNSELGGLEFVSDNYTILCSRAISESDK